MAQRQLGSSLLARAGAGGRLRETEESRIQKPEIPGKGAPGTLGRAQVEEPLVRQVSPGSAKIVSVQPTVEGTTAPNIVPEDVESVGILPTSPRVEARPGANNQALFQGGVSTSGQEVPGTGVPTSKVQQGRGATVTSSQGGGARPAVANVPQVQGAQTQQQGQAARVVRTPLAPALGNIISPKAFAEEGVRRVQEFVPTAGQFLAGGAGKLLTAVGSALNAPQLRPGGLGAQLQSFGGQPTRTSTGSNIARPGSISSGLRSVAQNVGNVVNNLRSQAQNVFSGLRSLATRRR